MQSFFCGNEVIYHLNIQHLKEQWLDRIHGAQQCLARKCFNTHPLSISNSFLHVAFIPVGDNTHQSAQTTRLFHSIHHLMSQKQHLLLAPYDSVRGFHYFLDKPVLSS